MFDSAAEFARELGVDNTTVINYIKQGKIKAHRAKNKKLFKIPEEEKFKIKKLSKPYPKWQKSWTKSEDNLLIYSKCTTKELSRILKRSEGSIRVHKTILRKKGLI